MTEETKPYPTDYTFKLIYSDGSEEDELPPSATTALNDWIELMYEEDICCECGESVAQGSGKFVNRIPEMSGILARVSMNRPHPTGAWVCAECEMRIEKDCIDEEECLLDKGGTCADCKWNAPDEDVPVEEDVRVENPMKAWNVCLNGKVIDTVFYDDDVEADEVKRGLVEHDSYDPAIEVHHVRLPRKYSRRKTAK